jgi:AcrR family transcriptional regulator
MTVADIGRYTRLMGRWQPNARGRLEQAAMELYGERGFEQTTVAEIAERAGLTERTFFRYFADKREVLFGGTEEVKGLLVGAVAGAPESALPLDAVGAGLIAFGTLLEDRRGREFARRRQRIIASNNELRERELIKLATWAAELAEALRARGVDEATANLAGEVGIAVFRTAFDRWAGTARGPKLPELIRETLDELNALTAASRFSTAPARR